MSSFIIKQGTDGGITYPVLRKDAAKTPVNLVGWSGVCQLRSINNDKLLHTFSTANNTMILEMGKLTLIWSAAETSMWTWSQAKYGIEVTTPEGKVGRLPQGIVTLSKEVTK